MKYLNITLYLGPYCHLGVIRKNENCVRGGSNDTNNGKKEIGKVNLRNYIKGKLNIASKKPLNIGCLVK